MRPTPPSRRRYTSCTRPVSSSCGPGQRCSLPWSFPCMSGLSSSKSFFGCTTPEPLRQLFQWHRMLATCLPKRRHREYTSAKDSFQLCSERRPVRGAHLEQVEVVVGLHPDRTASMSVELRWALHISQVTAYLLDINSVTWMYPHAWTSMLVHSLTSNFRERATGPLDHVSNCCPCLANHLSMLLVTNGMTGHMLHLQSDYR